MSSCPIFVQDSTGSITLYLELTADGSAATALTFADITADLKKEGGAFAAMTLTGANFTEIDGGFYQLDLAAADNDTLGNSQVRVSGATIRTTLLSAFVAEVVPTSPTTTPAPPKTAIFGFIKDADGAPVNNATVSVKILSTPYISNAGDDGVLITDGLIITQTDVAGFFTIDLITGAIVEFFISSANYRRTITVPVNSTNLFDLP